MIKTVIKARKLDKIDLIACILTLDASAESEESVSDSILSGNSIIFVILKLNVSLSVLHSK